MSSFRKSMNPKRKAFKVFSRALSPFLNKKLKGTAVLFYHEISSRRFKKHVNFLRDRYKIISVRELINSLKERRGAPENSIVITFDDGYRSNYTDVFPIVKEMEIPISIFITTGEIGSKRFWHHKVDELNEIAGREYKELNRKYLKRVPHKKKREIISRFEEKLNYNPKEREMLSWDEIKKMSESKFVDFGAHTVSHPILTKAKNFREEIIKSKEVLEEKINKSIRYFAYPNGVYNEKIKGVVKSNFEASFTTKEQIINTKSYINNYEIGRFYIPEHFSGKNASPYNKGSKKDVEIKQAAIK